MNANIAGPVPGIGANAIRVLVVDRAPLLRHGVVESLSGDSVLRVVGSVGSVVDATRWIDRNAANVDVALIDSALADGTGLQVCEHLQRVAPTVAVVLMTDGDDDAHLAGVVRAGARGYLLRTCGIEELRSAVLAVHSGQSLVSPIVAARLLNEFANLVRQSENPAVGPGGLSLRERQVLVLVADGLSNKAIADRLFISENTVKNHVRNIHDKLGVHTRTEAVVRAVRDGLLEIA